MNNVSFRIGTTSYIIPADIVPNVQYLAGQVQDVELVLFEVDDGRNNLPTAETIRELQRLAEQHDMSYTVHLPLDLRLSVEGNSELSRTKARRVIEVTRPLNPWAYLVHLDGSESRSGIPSSERQRCVDQSVRSLELLATWAGGAEKLAVENLEGDDPDRPSPILERLDVSRCVDVGHLWMDGHDPLPHLLASLPRTRVIHLHGLAERDHKSLAHMAPEQLNPVIAALVRGQFRGVVTLEVFGEEDFHSSLAALHKSLRAISAC